MPMEILSYIARSFLSFKIICIIILVMISVTRGEFASFLKSRSGKVVAPIFVALVMLGLPFFMIEYSSPASVPVSFAFKGTDIIRYSDQLLEREAGSISPQVMAGKPTRLDLVVKRRPTLARLSIEDMPDDLQMFLENPVHIAGERKTYIGFTEEETVSLPYEIDVELEPKSILRSAYVDIEAKKRLVERDYRYNFSLVGKDAEEEKTITLSIPKDADIRSAYIHFDAGQISGGSAVTGHVVSGLGKVTGKAITDITGMATTETCLSCDDCSAKIISASEGDTVKLSNDISSTGTCIAFNGSDGITLDCQGNTITGSGGLNTRGIFLDDTGDGSNNNVIKDCIIQEFSSGLMLQSSSGNQISDIGLSSHSSGLKLAYSIDNQFSGIESFDNSYGIEIVSDSDNNRFSGLTVYENSLYGISIDGTYDGGVDGNSISDSIIENNDDIGIIIKGDASGNIIKDSYIRGHLNDNAIRVVYLPSYASPLNNRIYNNYLNNTANIVIGTTTSQNYYSTSLDCSKGNIIGEDCLGGNFYAKPDGTGFSETCDDVDSDGICDDSYTHAIQNIDDYPLTNIKISEPLDECDSCKDCTAKLQIAGPGDTIKVTADLYMETGMPNLAIGWCINFNGTDEVTLDCQDHEIIGTDQGNKYGIWLSDEGDGSKGNTISDCVIRDFYSAIFLEASDDNEITGCEAESNYGGLRLVESDGNTISGFYSSQNADNGIDIFRSSNNLLKQLEIFDNTEGTGIYIRAYTDGPPSNNNIISTSSLHNNAWGAVRFVGDCDENIVKDSRMEKNSWYAMAIEDWHPEPAKVPENNLVYNNYFNNTYNFFFGGDYYPAEQFLSTELDCSLKNIIGGDCIGGNFWANPEGTGFSEACEDIEVPFGVCDTFFNRTNDHVRIDWYPLARESSPAHPSCSDGIKNQDETDVDCGGSCELCDVGASCLVGSDCITGLCNQTTLLCYNLSAQGIHKENCSDGMLNQGETDVDCGGSCSPCQLGLNCTINSDCISELCDIICIEQIPGNCSDGMKNQDESDIDCGGVCEPCTLGLNCSIDSDCTSGYCNTTIGTCQNMSMLPYTMGNCSDGIRNQDESDIDCGGSACGKCEINSSCIRDADCDSSSCIHGLCTVAEGYDRPTDQDTFYYITLNNDIIRSGYSYSGKIDLSREIESVLERCEKDDCEIKISFVAKNAILDVEEMRIAFGAYSVPEIRAGEEEIDPGRADISERLRKACDEGSCLFSTHLKSDQEAGVNLRNLSISYIVNATTEDISGQIDEICENYPCHVPIRLVSEMGGKVNLTDLELS